jgi:hypothetical protein
MKPSHSPEASAPVEATAQPSANPSIAIDSISEPVILAYFQTLNSEEYLATSQLFAEEGCLQPPFESAVEGREAIATYLQKEAPGLLLHPQKGTAKLLENGCTEFQIVGKVQTSLFLVNVCWNFSLNPLKEILLVKINLLASLQELLNLREKKEEEEGKNEA